MIQQHRLHDDGLRMFVKQHLVRRRKLVNVVCEHGFHYGFSRDACHKQTRQRVSAHRCTQHPANAHTVFLVHHNKQIGAQRDHVTLHLRLLTALSMARRRCRYYCWPRWRQRMMQVHPLIATNLINRKAQIGVELEYVGN